MHEQLPTLHVPSQLHGLNCAHTCGEQAQRQLSQAKQCSSCRAAACLVFRVCHAPAHGRRSSLARRPASLAAASAALPAAAPALLLLVILFAASFASAQAL
jgi:hypothetical protein